MQYLVKVQLEAIARGAYKFIGDTYENQLKTLTEEYEKGMFTDENINNVMESISRTCWFHYQLIHDGKSPGVQ